MFGHFSLSSRFNDLLLDFLMISFDFFGIFSMKFVVFVFASKWTEICWGRGSVDGRGMAPASPPCSLRSHAAISGLKNCVGSIPARWKIDCSIIELLFWGLLIILN